MAFSVGFSNIQTCMTFFKHLWSGPKMPKKAFFFFYYKWSNPKWYPWDLFISIWLKKPHIRRSCLGFTANQWLFWLDFKVHSTTSRNVSCWKCFFFLVFFRAFIIASYYLTKTIPVLTMGTEKHDRIFYSTLEDSKIILYWSNVSLWIIQRGMNKTKEIYIFFNQPKSSHSSRFHSVKFDSPRFDDIWC